MARLVERWRLPDAAAGQLRSLVEMVIEGPGAPTALRDPARVIDDHLADSLVALDRDEVLRAGRVVDIGSGAGFPGLVLAVALPTTRFCLLESVGRKCAFMRAAVARCGLPNVEVINQRAESWREGLEAFDVATARAVGRPDAVLEYAAPLLNRGGTLIAWRGRIEESEEEAAARAASRLAMEIRETVRVRPYPAAEHRHLQIVDKVGPTPAGFPRRPGAALKRPLGRSGAPRRTAARAPQDLPPSDRPQR